MLSMILSFIDGRVNRCAPPGGTGCWAADRCDSGQLSEKLSFKILPVTGMILRATVGRAAIMKVHFY